MTAIEWTEMTWNPTLGCSVASPGCRFCYAARMASRLARIGTTAGRYAPTVRVANGHPVWTGALVAAPDRTWELPLRRRKPTTFFTNSMSDLFHESMPDAWIARAFEIMRACPQHVFQVLTKRPGRMLHWTQRHGCPPHVWLGASVEDQRRADERLPQLARVPAETKFISAEPLLEAVALAPWLDRINWLIVGAESGPRARPFELDWARKLRDECVPAAVPFFFKQDATERGKKLSLPVLDGKVWAEMPSRRPGGLPK